MDKELIFLDKNTAEYETGLNAFVNYALEHASFDGTIKCPCKRCHNGYNRLPYVVQQHLMVDGMDPKYVNIPWTDHGEHLPNVVGPNLPGTTSYQQDLNLPGSSHQVDSNMQDMLHDALGMYEAKDDAKEELLEPAAATEGPSLPNGHTPDAQKFYELLKKADTDLYPGAGKKMFDFLIKLYQIKALNNWSDASFTQLLELLKAYLPPGETLLGSFYLTKKFIKSLGLTYKKIDACPNDCMLYWKLRVRDRTCYKCGASRYKEEEDTCPTNTSSKNPVPVKVLRYFPLVPRLQRLFMSRHTSEFMVWHSDPEKRPRDGVLRPPADSLAWKELDKIDNNFSSDGRNVRLGLASDGFNPFGMVSLSHSTWPVIITVYNLPPWLCMKKSYMMLSLLIPGPKTPGNDIDVYLEPLIDELKLLWTEGVPTYDAFKKEIFQMRAALLWTINDFPAYAMLSGYSTKGFKACPTCGEETDSIRLHHGNKEIYMGHRMWLEDDHIFHTWYKNFNGSTEHRRPPKPITESVIGTLLGIDGKNKDSLKARLDMVLMGVKKSLHPEKRVSTTSGHSSCTTKVLLELRAFFRQLCTKVGTADHFRDLSNRIAETLCKLDMIMPPSFFDIMVHLVIHLADEAAIAGPVQFRWMYPIERYLHDLKKYVRNKSKPEASIAEGYIIEECLSFCTIYLSDGVESKRTRIGRNADDPDIVPREGLPIFTETGRSIQSGREFTLTDREWKRAHTHVLINCPEISQNLKDHVANTQRTKSRLTTLMEAERQANNTFSTYFGELIERRVHHEFVDPDIRALATGPSTTARRFKKYIMNGFWFFVKSIDARSKTQNSGVFVKAGVRSYATAGDHRPRDGVKDYYGVLTDIIELDYHHGRKVLLFDCDWADNRVSNKGVKMDAYGFILVNFDYLLPKPDTLILASQAVQFIYIQDPTEPNWHTVIRTRPRDLFDMGTDIEPESYDAQNLVTGANDDGIARTDVDGVIVNEMSHSLQDEEGYEENAYDESETQDVGGWFNVQQDDESETHDTDEHQQDNSNGSLEAHERTKKPRGPNQKNWAREGREKLLWNRFGLPKGPRLKVARFSRFLGILAKDFTLFPISTPDYWNFKIGDADNLERAWKRVHDTIDWSDPFVASLEGKIKRRVLSKLNERWKHWKSQLRKKWYKPFKNSPRRFQKPDDDRVNERQWKLFVDYMDKKKHQEVIHGKEPDRWELFKLTHQRKGSLEPIDAASAKAIADFEEAEQERLSKNIDITTPEVREEMYAEVLGKEKGNKVRGVGAGVTWNEVPGIHVEEKGVSREVKQLREQLEEQAKKAQDREARMMEELQSKMAEQTKKMEQMFEVRCVEMALQQMGEVFRRCGINVDTQEDAMQTMSQIAHNMSQRPSNFTFSPHDDVYRPIIPFDCPDIQRD
ncbi:hypothetical protein ACLB2K_055123 [Fragaria x ananassa]